MKGLASYQPKSILASTVFWLFALALLSRLAILFFGYVLKSHLGIEEPILEAMCQWDCGWYNRIASEGYPTATPDGRLNGQNSWAFLPVYPAIVSLISQLLPISNLTAGFVASILAFSLTVPLAYTAYKPSLGESGARFLASLLIANPISMYNTVPYTEAVFGLLLVTAILLCKQRRWIAAGLTLAVLSATRSVGVYGCMLLLVFAVQQFGLATLVRQTMRFTRFKLADEEFMRVYLGFALAPLGLFTYVLFLHVHVGDGFAFRHVTEAGWRWEWQFPVFTLLSAISNASEAPRLTYLSATALAATGLAALLMFRKYYAEGILFSLFIFTALSGLINSNHRYFFAHLLPWLAVASLVPNRPGIRSALLCAMTGAWGIYLVAWLQRQSWTT